MKLYIQIGSEKSPKKLHTHGFKLKLPLPQVWVKLWVILQTTQHIRLQLF